MGERGPIGNPYGKRAEQRARKLRLVGREQPLMPPAPEKAERIPMPARIRENPEAARFWKQHCRMLQELGRLEPEFRATFARLCLVHARIQEYSERIDVDGEILLGPRGAKQRHPLLTALRQAEATFTELSGRFGLDPKSALRLPSPQQAAKSRRARLLATDDEWSKLAKFLR